MALNGGNIMLPSEEAEILNALKLKVQYGWQRLNEDPAFLPIQDTINFVNGHHHLLETRSKSSHVYLNRVRKIYNEIAAILTDVRPLGGYETENHNSKQGQDVLSKCNRRWWMAQKTDRVMRDVVGYSCVGGSGYLMLTHYPDHDDIVPEAVDPRDVVPIEPVFGARSIQDWRGVCVRKRVPLSDAHRIFPDSREWLKEQNGNGWFGPETTRIAGTVKRFATTFWDSMLNRKTRFDPPGVEIMYCYFRDDSRNLTNDVKVMGDPSTNWSYEVLPGGKLYPRGRLVVCTTTKILWDGPNRYWHGMFPLVRFTLIPAPWTILGLSILQDVMALQHSLNESVRGLDDARNKILDPAIIADRHALSKQELDKLDARLPGGRYHVDTRLTGNEGFRFSDPPNLGNYYMQYLAFIIDQMDDLSGVKGIQAFQQLKQMPAKDTIQEFLQSMTPVLKDMARSLEVSVNEVAEMMLFNFMQFYGTERRREILGEDGLAPADFEGDVGNMIPAGEGTTEERARREARQFKFVVAPNTFLNISNITDRMSKFQLWSRGGLSTYSIWEAFDIPNRGKAPAESEGERMVEERRVGLLQGPPPELVQMQLATQLAQLQMAMAQMQVQQMTPTTQAPPTTGEPTTAEPGGGAPRPPGRPPEGIEAPRIESKDGGTRSTVAMS